MAKNHRSNAVCAVFRMVRLDSLASVLLQSRYNIVNNVLAVVPDDATTTRLHSFKEPVFMVSEKIYIGFGSFDKLYSHANVFFKGIVNIFAFCSFSEGFNIKPIATMDSNVGLKSAHELYECVSACSIFHVAMVVGKEDELRPLTFGALFSFWHIQVWFGVSEGSVGQFLGGWILVVRGRMRRICFFLWLVQP